MNCTEDVEPGWVGSDEGPNTEPGSRTRLSAGGHRSGELLARIRRDQGHREAAAAASDARRKRCSGCCPHWRDAASVRRHGPPHLPHRTRRDLQTAASRRVAPPDCSPIRPAPSTVARDVAANGAAAGYRACYSAERARRLAARPKGAVRARPGRQSNIRHTGTTGNPAPAQSRRSSDAARRCARLPFNRSAGGASRNGGATLRRPRRSAR